MTGGSLVVALGGATLLVLAGCGAPGLPPGGPAPGNVDVGYGTQEKEDVTGAVTSLADHPIPPGPVRLEDLLRGRVAGLQIFPLADGSYKLLIRGTNSLTPQQEQEPLVVVDGVQIAPGTLHTALSGLTRDDIRQVDVLKDVASTAVYGTRGGGGVIIITTTRR